MLAEAPEAPIGSESGAAMNGKAGVVLTVTVTVGLFVERHPLAAVTVRV